MCIIFTDVPTFCELRSVLICKGHNYKYVVLEDFLPDTRDMFRFQLPGSGVLTETFAAEIIPLQRSKKPTRRPSIVPWPF